MYVAMIISLLNTFTFWIHLTCVMNPYFTSYRSRNIVAVNSALRQPWKKRLQDRAEKTAMKQLEQELREEAQKERVVCICVAANIAFSYL